ncbi:MAG: histidinol-phosphate transaminase [Lachnospiraceae bacterium]
MNTNLFENNIRKTNPYVPGEQPKNNVIKLNTNENPYPPAPGVGKALKELDVERMRLYPDPTAELLVKELAHFHQVKPEQVFVGVGSDDVLAMCFLTFFNSKKPILFPETTYSFYKVWAELYRIPYECPKVDADFKICAADYYQDNGGVIFPNPNAPTAIYEDLDFVEDIIKHNPDVIVIVDEAYIDFAGPSALALIDQYENLIVVQTFSKARSMAGMRIGYAIANQKLIAYLNDVKYSFNSYTMDMTSLICGAESVKDQEYFEETTHKIIETREWAKQELKKLGFMFPDAKANFIFASHPNYDAKHIFEELKKNNIYVRYFPGEKTGQYLRITIGTREEMTQLFAFLKKYMK